MWRVPSFRWAIAIASLFLSVLAASTHAQSPSNRQAASEPNVVVRTSRPSRPMRSDAATFVDSPDAEEADEVAPEDLWLKTKRFFTGGASQVDDDDRSTASRSSRWRRRIHTSNTTTQAPPGPVSSRRLPPKSSTGRSTREFPDQRTSNLEPSETTDEVIADDAPAAFPAAHDPDDVDPGSHKARVGYRRHYGIPLDRSAGGTFGIPRGYETRCKVEDRFGPPDDEVHASTYLTMVNYSQKGIRFYYDKQNRTISFSTFPPGPTVGFNAGHDAWHGPISISQSRESAERD